MGHETDRDAIAARDEIARKRRDRIVANAAEETSMFCVAQKHVQKLFGHVRKVAKETHDPDYLPRWTAGSPYFKLNYLRRTHRTGQLRAPD